MHIALLGMGRLGRSMAPLLRAAGHQVSAWTRHDPLPRAELCWITVSDGAVAQVASRLPAGPIVLHASGMLSHEVLRPHAPSGSLHPLQTFPGPEVAVPDLRGAPAAVAGDPQAQRAAEQIARSLGMEPFAVPGDRRLYHLAAVLAGNLAPVLLAEAAGLLVQAGVPAHQAGPILEPLATSALKHATAHGAAAALTGPAARGDETTIQAHRAALAEHAPGLATLYDALTQRAKQRLEGD